jgi:hypothetical protein
MDEDFNTTMISLENTVFQLSAVVKELPRTVSFQKGKFTAITDFGTVFIGLDKASAKARDGILLCSAPQSGAPCFTAPEEWRMPQLLRALGAFKSGAQAAKNGWNKEIEPGITEIQIRINKVRGSLWIHRVTDECPWIIEDGSDEKEESLST